MAADGAVGIGDSARLLAPGCCGQDHIGQTRRVGLRDVADHDKIAALYCGGHRIGVGHGHGGVGVNDPQRLDPPRSHGAEQINRLEAGRLGNRRAVPETLHRSAVGWIVDLQMAGQHIGKAAHLASAHGVGLAGHRKRPHAGTADATRRQMAI